MSAEDLIELLEECPIVTPTIVAIGLSPSNGSRLAERITHCSINHIVEAEPVEKTR